MGHLAWQQMAEAARDSVVRTMPKVAAEWQLIFAAENDLEAIARINAPTLLVCGACTRSPARRVVDVLRLALPGARYVEIGGAGHEPLHASAAVADAIRRHAASIDRRRSRRELPPLQSMSQRSR